MGAYLSTFASCVPTYLYATLLSGQYNIPAIYAEVDAVYTNTAPVDAYRGAGRPEATYVVERLVETRGARDEDRPGGIPPAQLHHDFPHQTPVIMSYDAGDYDASLTRRLSLPTTRASRPQGGSGQKRQASRHRLLDLYRSLRYRPVSGCRLAWRRRGPLGIGRSAGQSCRHGRSPDWLSQPRPGSRDDLRAVRLRPARHPDRNVSIVHGDTDKVQFGMGTYGSRSAPSA